MPISSLDSLACSFSGHVRIIMLVTWWHDLREALRLAHDGSLASRRTHASGYCAASCTKQLLPTRACGVMATENKFSRTATMPHRGEIVAPERSLVCLRDLNSESASAA
jgi:hypothetical protein